jgi:hypothetical protein
MKKIINNMLLLLAATTSALMVSCKDDDDKNSSSQSTDREFMTMFICDNTRGKGDDYAYNSGIDAAYPHGNTIHLYWYGVKDCAGYQIQMALMPKVTGGADAWAKIQGTNDLLVDSIVGPDKLDMVLKDLQYKTDYRFAIRALSKKDRNVKGDQSSFEHASNWFGHGNGRQWQEYLNIQTRQRYYTPTAIYVDQSVTTENTMTVHFNSNITQLGMNLTASDMTTLQSYIASYNADTNPSKVFTLKDVKMSIDDKDKENIESLYKNFNTETNGDLGYKYLTVTPSPNNPNASVNEKWRKYAIQPQDLATGYVVVDGLSPNSVYVIDVVDPRIEIPVDAKYNTLTQRTDGKPGAPILLRHDSLMAIANDLPLADNDDYKRADVFALAAEYDAAPISPTLYDFISNTQYAEGQTFLLEGGKTYYIDGNDITCKGFVLRTDPADVAKGLRARVLNGIGHSAMYEQGQDGDQWQGPYTCFMFGRQPEAGEGGAILMKKLAFYDIDFDNPKALNYGDQAAGIGTAAGNYFFNMYSNGMAVELDSLVIENCTFKRMVRGFIREQGSNYKVWNHVLIKNNLFFDCGYYNQSAGGYCMIDGSGQNSESNLYGDFKCIENTFYDSPYPAFIREEKVPDDGWLAGSWNITFENNTLINFNTRANGAIFKMRSLPNGSIFNVKNNLFVLCKKPGDARVLAMWGADIRETQTMQDGSMGHVTLNFGNNWSTNNDLTENCIFSSSAWTATSNNFGTLLKDQVATLNGTLEVQVANISATDLMIQPCPPHVAITTDDRNMHRADALDGTATTEYNVNLKFKNTKNEIVENNAGATRWYK